MKTFWENISYAGIDEGMDTGLLKKIKTTNQIVFSISVIAFCYLFIFYFLGYKKEGVAVLLVVSAMFTPIILNSFKFYLLSRLWFLVTINLAVYIYAKIFGIDAGIQLACISFVSLPWVLFEFTDTKYIFIGSVMPVVCLFSIYLTTSTPVVQISPEVQQGIYLSIILVVFIILSLSMMFFVRQQYISEKRLIKSKEDLHMRNARLEEIAWMLSHRLRKPVATILGLVQLINIKDLEDGDTKRSLEHIHTAGRELDDMINEVDKYTRNNDEDHL